MKVRQAYERALALINERDSAGAYHDDVADFEKNAPDLVNSIVTLLWLDECTIRGVSVRDFSWSFEPVTGMEDEIPLHDALASGVLPFALASFLLMEEDYTRSDHFFKLYSNARQTVLNAFYKGERSSVKNVYGGYGNGKGI